MDGPPAIHAWLLLVLAAAGCTTPAQVERLEARLRDQFDRLVVIDEQLRTAREEVIALRRQRDGLLARGGLATPGEPPVLPEQADLLVQARGLRINTWLTGGADRDATAGDDGLVVLLQPYDADGEPLKLPGRIRIELLDPALSDGHRRLGTWRFTFEDCRARWHGGMLARGFLFRLPWQTPPQHSRLLLHAHFETGDGRAFDDDALIKVSVAGKSGRE